MGRSVIRSRTHTHHQTFPSKHSWISGAQWEQTVFKKIKLHGKCWGSKNLVTERSWLEETEPDADGGLRSCTAAGAAAAGVMGDDRLREKSPASL